MHLVNESHWQYVTIGSGNGSVTKRWQAITQVYDDQVWQQLQTDICVLIVADFPPPDLSGMHIITVIIQAR